MVLKGKSMLWCEFDFGVGYRPFSISYAHGHKLMFPEKGFSLRNQLLLFS
jgi:hypothetical protein